MFFVNLLAFKTLPGLASRYTHTGVQVIGLTTSIGVLKGTSNEMFAIGLVFSLVVRRPHL